MQKKLYVPLLIFALLAGLLSIPATAATVLASGDCGATGNDVTWTLDREGLLTVSGTGAMNDYTIADDVPWHSYLDKVKTVVIQSGVTTVGQNAFQSCTQLETVTLPAQGLTSIGDVAFYHCDALASITIPGSVTKIGNNAFGFCALSAFQVPASVESIGEGAFYKCAALTAITVAAENENYSAADGILFDHDKTELICYPAKKDLTEYTAPVSVETVGSYAFHSNPTLKKVTFATVKDANGNPKAEDEAGKLKAIRAYAFAYSTALEEITFPSTLSSVGNYAFFECASLSDDNGNATGKVYYEGSRQEWTALSIGNLGNSRLTNAEVVFTDMVQDNIAASGECGSLGNNASWSLSKEGELRISGSGTMRDYRNADSVPWATYKADDADPQIKKVTILDGISNVGDYAFFECHRLTEVQLPATLERVGSSDAAYSRAFADCSALTTINLSETSVTSIGNYAFNGCAALASVAFPDTLLTIGSRAFLNCAALTEVTIPASVTAVGDWAFRGCTNLAAFTMEPLQKDAAPHYTSFGAYVLADCAALENLSFTENLTVLGDYALTKCAKLKEVSLPASVSGVGNCVFLSCPALAAVDVDKENQTYCTAESGMLMNKDQTYILYYPSGRNSTACSIPESVTSVAAFAFQDAKLLTDIYYKGSRKQWDNDVVPNIGLPNDPLFNIMQSEEHFQCEGVDLDDADRTSIDFFTAQQTENGATAVAQVHCGQDVNLVGAFAFCAMYDEEGRFLGIASGEIDDESENPENANSNSETPDSGNPDDQTPEEEPPQPAQIPELTEPGKDYNLSFTLDDEAATLYLFILDGENRPQCQRNACQVDAAA